MIRCNDCGKTFKTKSGLGGHRYQKHEKDTADKSPEDGYRMLAVLLLGQLPNQKDPLLRAAIALLEAR